MAMEAILAYPKKHPYATGTIVIIGGLIFFMIVNGGGSSSTAYVDSGPSDAEIAANATVQSANIAAQAQGAQVAAQVNLAQMGYGYQLQSDELDAQIAMATLEAQKELGLGTLASQDAYYKQQFDSQNLAITKGADVDLANIAAGAMIQQSSIQAQAQYIDAQKAVALGTLASNTALAAQQNQAQTDRVTAITSSLGTVKKKSRDDVLQALITGQPYYPVATPGNDISSIVGSIGKVATSLPFL